MIKILSGVLLALLFSTAAFGQGSGYSSGKFGVSGGNNTWPGGVATSHNGIPSVSLSTTCNGTVTPASSFGNYTLTVTGTGCVIALPTSIAAGDIATFLITEGAGANVASFASGYNGWIGGTPFVATPSVTNSIACQFTGAVPAAVCGPGGVQAGLVSTVVGWTLVNHVSAQGASTATTSPIDTTAGGTNFIVITRSYNGTATLSDSISNIYTTNTAAVTGGNKSDISFKYSPTTSGTHQFTCSGSSIFCTIVVETWARTGGGTTGLDQAINSAQGTGLTSLASGSFTPNQPNELVITSLALTNAGSAIGISSGFTQFNAPYSAGVAFGGAIGHQVQTTPATAVNPLWSWTGSVDAAVAGASFK